MKRVAILQSNYLPWKGYFDLIAAVDEFIVYDCVQYTKNDWRNRNQIKTPQGKSWLTVPVRQRSLEQTVAETEVADARCFRKHWSTFRQNYAKAPHVRYCEELLAPLFERLSLESMLSNVNVIAMNHICGVLGVATPIVDSSVYVIEGNRNERLISLCRQAGASHYLSGPAARVYLDEDAFLEAGIVVEWAEYQGYPEYPQPHPPFDHYVSIMDLLASTGPDAGNFMRWTRREQS
ncbi:WbqC family protein [Marilutibacter maris]|uniref:WbqC family protein n=1 Tax=Marilutibacter maris TaxID=1605891 RepID=UPI000DA7BCA1|nr:WbqC family protein [Lysobacter maris]